MHFNFLIGWFVFLRQVQYYFTISWLSVCNGWVYRRARIKPPTFGLKKKTQSNTVIQTLWLTVWNYTHIKYPRAIIWCKPFNSNIISEAEDNKWIVKLDRVVLNVHVLGYNKINIDLLILNILSLNLRDEFLLLMIKNGTILVRSSSIWSIWYLKI